MKRIALETFYGDPMKEASGRLPPLSGASQYTTSHDCTGLRILDNKDKRL